MSIAQNPVTGKMAKSFANVNTYVHRGQNVISSKAFNRKDPNTAAQQAQRSGFRVVSAVGQLLGSFLDKGFPACPERLSPYNYFMKLNLPNALDTSGDTPVVDYSLLSIARGNLNVPNLKSATFDAAKLTVEVLTNSGLLNVNAEDLIYLLAGTQAGGLYAISAIRGEAESQVLVLNMPGVKAEEIAFSYVFATSPDGKKASNSMYVAL